MATNAPGHDTEAITRALAAGQTTVVDTSTGQWRTVYATCPRDGARAAVRRLVRGERGAITALTMRCPRCGRDFTPPVESLQLE